jgi:hypothetical protein
VGLAEIHNSILFIPIDLEIFKLVTSCTRLGRHIMGTMPCEIALQFGRSGEYVFVASIARVNLLLQPRLIALPSSVLMIVTLAASDDDRVSTQVKCHGHLPILEDMGKCSHW